MHLLPINREILQRRKLAVAFIIGSFWETFPQTSCNKIKVNKCPSAYMLK